MARAYPPKTEPFGRGGRRSYVSAFRDLLAHDQNFADTFEVVTGTRTKREIVEHQHDDHQQAHKQRESLWRSAIQATLHCLTGCAIGEVLGMVLATALGWGNAASIALSVALAFFFGYSLTIRPVLRAGLGFRRAAASPSPPTRSRSRTMALVDNAFILIVPGAMAAGSPTASSGEPRTQPRHCVRAHRASEPLADRARPRPPLSCTNSTQQLAAAYRRRARRRTAKARRLAAPPPRLEAVAERAEPAVSLVPTFRARSPRSRRALSGDDQADPETPDEDQTMPTMTMIPPSVSPRTAFGPAISPSLARP
jgi:hypothetical protein